MPVRDHEVSTYKKAKKADSDGLSAKEIKKIYREYYSNKRMVESGETYRSQAPSSYRKKPSRVAREGKIG
jgi:hypothetical protein